MSKANGQINLDGLSVEELDELTRNASKLSNAKKTEKKQGGIDIIKKTMADFYIDKTDLITFGIISKNGDKKEISKDDADFEIDGQFWKLGQLGKTPEFVIQALKAGNKLSKYIINNKVTTAQADDKETKLRASPAFKTP